ncbi:hypothetical protein [Terrisporobacter vanillatitrophus]|uniref:hypothetical protein n=1 Tax=Terrisporobacter vanillatitrophus TaxID=3058402 RepID=UPI003EB79AAE
MLDQNSKDWGVILVKYDYNFKLKVVIAYLNGKGGLEVGINYHIKIIIYNNMVKNTGRI